MLLILTLALKASQPCCTSSKVCSLVLDLWPFIYFILFYSTYYTATFLCLHVCSSPAMLNNTVVVAVPYRYCSRGDSVKCSTDLLPFPGSEDSKRWQPGGSSGFSFSLQLMLINSEIHTSFSGLIWLDAVLQSVIRAGPVSAVCEW